MINYILASIKPHTLAMRVMLLIVLPLILLGGLMVWFFFDRHWDTQTRQISKAISGELLFLADLVEQNKADEGVLAFYDEHFNIKIIATQPPQTPRSCFGSCEFVFDNARAVLAPREVVAQSGSEGVEVYFRLENGIWLQASIIQKRLSASTTLLFVVFVLLSAVILGAVAIRFSQSQVRTVQQLAEAMDAFGSGLREEPLKYGGADEIRLAIGAFNKMKVRLKRLVVQRGHMLAGVSHDIKTVLTRMNLALNNLPETKMSKSIKIDVKEMETILNSYLEFVQQGGNKLSKNDAVTTFNLSEDLAHLTTRPATKGKVEVKCPASLIIKSSPVLIKRIINNLVANSLRYGTKVIVTASKQKRHLTLIVEDNGPGIPANQRKEVIKPFYRIDDSRTPGKGGTGLGLTIVRDAAWILGGDIEITQSALGGAKAKVRLPNE